MSGSKKIAKWLGNTDSYSFEVAFYEDEEQGLFRARIEAKSFLIPGTRRMLGRAPRRVKIAEQDSLQDEDLDMLIARTRGHITGRYGEIKNLQQTTTED